MDHSVANKNAGVLGAAISHRSGGVLRDDVEVEVHQPLPVDEW